MPVSGIRFVRAALGTIGAVRERICKWWLWMYYFLRVAGIGLQCQECRLRVRVREAVGPGWREMICCCMDDLYRDAEWDSVMKLENPDSVKMILSSDVL